VLDQQIAPTLPIAQQRAHLRQRLRLDLAALGRLARAVAASQTSIVGARVHIGILLKPEERMALIKNKPSITIDRLRFSINCARPEAPFRRSYHLDR